MAPAVQRPEPSVRGEAGWSARVAGGEGDAGGMQAVHQHGGEGCVGERAGHRVTFQVLEGWVGTGMTTTAGSRGVAGHDRGEPTAGLKRGVTWVHAVNDQVAGIGAVVVPGTVRDSLYTSWAPCWTLGRNQGWPPPTPPPIATSSSGSSGLLGYRFSPHRRGGPARCRSRCTTHSRPLRAGARARCRVPRWGSRPVSLSGTARSNDPGSVGIEALHSGVEGGGPHG